MTIETTRDNLSINRVVEQKKDSFIIEGDAIIPDIKPDILNTISTSGMVCIYKKEIQEGKVKIDGTLNAYIMYLADGENSSVRGLNTNVDFSKIFDIQKAKKDMRLEICFNLKQIECKVLNGRKVNIKAVVEVEIKILSNENVEIVRGIEELKDIQTLQNSINVNTLIGEGMTKIYAKDTLTIDNGDNLAEIMKVNTRIINKNIKISYNKVLIKSDLEVKLLYLTDDNRINTIERTIPVIGFIDVKDVNDNNQCDVKYEIKNILIKPNNVEDHSIYIEAEIEAYCQAYENKEINVIQDIYSPTTNLSFEQKRVNVMQKKDYAQDVCNIREKQMITEIGNNKIYDVEVNPTILKQNILKDRIIYEGELNLTIIFSSNITGGVDTKIVSIPFDFNMEFVGVNSNSKINTTIDIGMQNFVIMPDESIDIKIDLIFSAESERNSEINIIENIQKDEEKFENPYSMVVYFVKPGDTLWNVAKKFKSTIEDVTRVNGIEQTNSLNIGQQLYIPRYNG